DDADLLTPRRIYQILPDDSAARSHYVRVIDNEGEDCIFTDPPFGGNIFYSDASMLYEAWLGEFTDEKRELVYHRRSKQQRQKDGYVFKTLEDYAQGMTLAFQEMFRVLKPGRWATVEFNNSDGSVFKVIKVAVRQAGFEIANMLLLDKQQKTFKQLQGAEGTQDVVDKDVVFNTCTSPLSSAPKFIPRTTTWSSRSPTRCASTSKPCRNVSMPIPPNTTTNTALPLRLTAC